MKLASFIAPVLALFCGMPLYTQDAGLGHGAPTPISTAVEEAENNNTQIVAADHAWSASEHIARQFRALANSQATPQNSSAGNVNPTASALNCNQTCTGVKIPQDSSHAGELQLWAEATQREADAKHAQVDVFRSNIADQVKTIYLRLAYLYEMYQLDDRGEADLAALIQDEISRYSLGMGSQADVLQAQLERTKLLRETTLQHEEVGGLQAGLKALLHRPPDSPDIIPESIAMTPLKYAASELLLKTAKQNPTLTADSRMIEAQIAQLDVAKNGTNLDFNLGYTFPQVGEDYSDGYVLTFNRQLPSGPGEDDRIAAATERVENSRSQASEDHLRQLAEVQKQYVLVTSSEELTRECKDGLIPQSKAVYESKLSGYESALEKFSTVIGAFQNEIDFENDYLQALLDHETALAHLETLTGEKLR